MSRRCLHILVLAVAVIMSVLLTRRCENVRNAPSTVVLHDTITNMVWDTSYVTNTVTVTLPLTDTLWRDSVRVDSVRVEVPISRYIYDTAICTDTTELGLRLSVSGYGVSLDSMMCRFRYSPTVVPKKSLFKDRFKVGVGVSAGYGTINRKADIYVGVGFFYVL